MNYRIVSDHDLVINGCVGIDVDTFADLNLAANDCGSSDPDIIANLRGRIDYCRRMNELWEGSFRMKDPERSGVCQVGILCAQDKNVVAIHINVLAGINSGRAR